MGEPPHWRRVNDRRTRGLNTSLRVGDRLRQVSAVPYDKLLSAPSLGYGRRSRSLLRLRSWDLPCGRPLIDDICRRRSRRSLPLCKIGRWGRCSGRLRSGQYCAPRSASAIILVVVIAVTSRIVRSLWRGILAVLGFEELESLRKLVPVSYTHLTLPTIYSV